MIHPPCRIALLVTPFSCPPKLSSLPLSCAALCFPSLNSCLKLPGKQLWPRLVAWRERVLMMDAAAADVASQCGMKACLLAAAQLSCTLQGVSSSLPVQLPAVDVPILIVGYAVPCVLSVKV